MLAGCVPTGPQSRAGFAPAGKTLFFRCGGWNPRWGASHQGTLVRVKTPAVAPLWSLLPTALGRSRQDRARNIVSSHPPPILVGVGSTRAQCGHTSGTPQAQPLLRIVPSSHGVTGRNCCFAFYADNRNTILISIFIVSPHTKTEVVSR